MLSAVTSNPDLQSIKGKNPRNVLNGCGAKPAPFNESDQVAQTSPLPWAQAEGRDKVWAGVLPSWSPPRRHGSSAPFSVRMLLSVPLKRGGELFSWSLKRVETLTTVLHSFCCYRNSFRHVGVVTAGSCAEMLTWELRAAARVGCLVCRRGTSVLAQGAYTMCDAALGYLLRAYLPPQPGFEVCQAPGHSIIVATKKLFSFWENKHKALCSTIFHLCHDFSWVPVIVFQLTLHSRCS